MKSLTALLLVAVALYPTGAIALDRAHELSILLDLAKQESSTVNTIWTFYITVSLGVAGWFATAGADRLAVMNAASRRVIAGAYLAFAFANWSALFLNHNLLDGFLADIQALLPLELPDAHATAKFLKPVSDFRVAGWSLPLALIIQPVVSAVIVRLVLSFGLPKAAAV